jgi:ferredoxin
MICFILYLFLYFSGPTTVLSEGMKNIIAAMKKNGIEHVSVCLSGLEYTHIL